MNACQVFYQSPNHRLGKPHLILSPAKAHAHRLSPRQKVQPPELSSPGDLRPYHANFPRYNTMTSNTAEEMENFQRLSDHYQPNLQGPLVGNKMPISVLMTEYAQADPTYRAKTASLSATHSAYRPVKGDGQCGWRATVFGYFETLLLSGDVQVVIKETARLKDFDETCRMAGFDMDLLMDLIEPTWELLEKIQHAAEVGNLDGSILMEIMNDESKSNSIVYHFKLMTSAYMGLRPQQYEPFLEMTMQEYRETRINPANQEIDQIGLQGLTDGVIAPAQIGLEVSYLDRSVGDEVTPHQFVENASNWPTIRLLYRPGHYDMIYQHSEPLLVMLMHQQAFQHPTMNTHLAGKDINSVLSEHLPVDEFYPPPKAFGQSTMSHGNNFAFTTHQQNYGGMYVPQYVDNFESPPLIDHYAPILDLGPRSEVPQPQLPEMRRNSNVTASSTSSTAAATSPPENRFRSTMHQLNYNAAHHSTLPLETGPLRSSPYNHAHFLNTDFQPALWNVQEYERPHR